MQLSLGPPCCADRGVQCILTITFSTGSFPSGQDPASPHVNDYCDCYNVDYDNARNYSDTHSSHHADNVDTTTKATNSQTLTSTSIYRLAA